MFVFIFEVVRLCFGACRTLILVKVVRCDVEGVVQGIGVNSAV